MRIFIVVDTSVFVAALLGAGGASREVLRGCLKKQYQPLIGTALFHEYESLLARDGLFDRCILTPAEREELLNAYLSVCNWTTIYYGWRPNLRDESDNHLIELAVAGGAQYVITKNTKDFRGAELQFPALQILRPESFIKEVG